MGSQVRTCGTWAVAPAHRFHHLNRAGDGDVNFALFSSVWDHLLGTYHYDPAKTPRLGELGIEGRRDYPVAYLAQLIEPFRREERKVSAVSSSPS